MKHQGVFDHEQLDVYKVELEFLTWVTNLLERMSVVSGPHRREVLDQLDRASLSALLNTAEGNGKRAGRQRAKFFDDARGSAVECAACLDALVAKSMATIEQISEGKRMLFRVVSMLCKLVDRFDDQPSPSREPTANLPPASEPPPVSQADDETRTTSGV